MNWKRALLPLFRIAAKPCIGLPHMYKAPETEQELMLAGAKPVMITSPDYLSDTFKAALETQDIVVIATKEFQNPNPSTVAVYALRGMEERGRELFTLYYETDNNITHDINGKSLTQRVGELLGYTDEDTAYFTGQGIYRNPLVRTALNLTTQPRRWARKEVMLMDAQDKKHEHPAADLT